MSFKPNRKFKKRYDRLFQKNPLGANMFLLIAELANDKGRVRTSEEEITVLFNTRFEDPGAYQLNGGGGTDDKANIPRLHLNSANTSTIKNLV